MLKEKINSENITKFTEIIVGLLYNFVHLDGLRGG